MSRKIPAISVLAHTVESIMGEVGVSRRDAKQLVNANFMLYSSIELPITFTQWDPDYRMRILRKNSNYHLVFYRLPEDERRETRDILKKYSVSLTKGKQAERISEGPRICDITPSISLGTAIRLYEKLARTNYLRKNTPEE